MSGKIILLLSIPFGIAAAILPDILHGAVVLLLSLFGVY